MRGLLFVVAAIGGGMTGGCVSSPPPEYPAARLKFDGAFVGRWKAVKEQKAPVSDPYTRKEEPDEILEIKSRDVPLRNGRVDSVGIKGLPRSRGKADDLAKGYTLLFEGEKSGANELDGFLFEAGGERLLGVQVSSRALEQAKLGPFVLPIHMVLRPTVVGDELRLEMSSAMYAWMPNVGWIDAEPGAKRDVVWAKPPEDKPGPPNDKPTSEPTFWITSDVDRLIEVYEKSMHVPGFWQEFALFRRVKE